LTVQGLFIEALVFSAVLFFGAAVAGVLAMEESVFLVEGRTGGQDPPGDRGLGERRAAAVKSALVAAGIPGSRLFSAGRQEPAGAALVSVVRMQ
jgi:hypothetical protein